MSKTALSKEALDQTKADIEGKEKAEEKAKKIAKASMEFAGLPSPLEAAEATLGKRIHIVSAKGAAARKTRKVNEEAA